MEAVVISVGGSVLVPGNRDAAYIKALAGLLRRCSKLVRILVVTGGGRPAREYIAAARSLGASERTLDELGIAVTRLNARLLLAALGRPKEAPPETIAAALRLSRRTRVVVMGGTTPGHTTDLVAAQLARGARAARLVNATSVDGVYSSDPRQNPRAWRFDRLTHAALLRITGPPKGRAGPTAVLDPLAARLAARTGLRLHVVNGRDLRNLEKAVLGREFHGTIVSD